MGLKEQLRKGEKRIGIWGLGYIGFSSMAYFARAGVSCIGTDKSKHRLDDVNTGQATIPNLDTWIGFKTVPLAKAGLMKATPDWKELIKDDIAVHLIAIPTEKDGKPYHEILKDVIQKICEIKSLKMAEPPLVVVESTLTPDAIDKIVMPLIEKQGLKAGKEILLGVAPRRDWFTSSDKSLKTLPRVVGGTTPETTNLMQSVFSLICDTVLKAKDHKHAAIVKSIENAYRQLDITFANQLSQAYPDLDMTSILKLVGTKWNIGCYSPDTSILTNEGFVKVDEIREGDRIWSVNPKTKNLELATAEKIYCGAFDGKMVRGCKKRYGVDFLITPNHNLPLQVYNSPGKVKFIKAEEALSYRKVRLISKVNWKGTGNFEAPNFLKNKNAEKWLSLLGWFTAEGSLYHKKGTGNYEVAIYQEKGKYHDEIFELFEDLGFNPNHRVEQRKGRIRVSNKALFDYLEKNIGRNSHTKRIPKEVLKLSTKYLNHLFDSLMKGDGSRQGKQYKYTTASKQLKDDLTEIALKLGYHVKIGKQKSLFKITLAPLENHELSPLRRAFKGHTFGPQLYKQRFTGFVYCPALDKNHTLIIERNGCVSINGNTYHPSFGTGGYCIPLAPQYVLEGAENPQALSLLEESLKTDFSQPEKVVESLAKRGSKKVGILGIAYMGDLKVHVLSPAIAIAKKLKEKGIEAKIQDPYYSEKELKEITGLGSFKFPSGLKEFDTILIVANHMQYRYTNESKVLENLENCRLILDNMGAWRDLKFPSAIEYHEAGDAGWME